jgi:hypothetical protein
MFGDASRKAERKAYCAARRKAISEESTECACPSVRTTRTPWTGWPICAPLACDAEEWRRVVEVGWRG